MVLFAPARRAKNVTLLALAITGLEPISTDHESNVLRSYPVATFNDELI